MKFGEVFLDHIRGSRYVFNATIDTERIIYKFPNGQKYYSDPCCAKLIDKLTEVRNNRSGRLIVNEKGEIITYRHDEQEMLWEPIFVDNLSNYIQFEHINNNPQNLSPGLIWTGFCSNHGSRFSITKHGKVFFKETERTQYSTITEKFYIPDFDQTILDNFHCVKDSGILRVNEYGHVWAPVNTEDVKEQMKDEEYRKAVNEQWHTFNEKLKRLVEYYQKEYYNSFTKKNESFTPIYIGKYFGEIHLYREKKPHIIKENPESDNNFFGV